MTLEEAIKIIENEGCFTISRAKEPVTDIKLIPWEKAKVNEAIARLGDFRFRVLINMNEESKARFRKLKEEYDMRKADETIITQKPIDIAEEVRKLHEEEESKQTTDWCKNPTLEEPANQFNEALLDEQAKKIMSQKKEIKHLNRIIASRNKDIWDLKGDVKKLSKEVARLYEIIDGKEDLLNKYRINDRSKKEMIAALRNELVEATVNKVNAQALKSAESALAYKEKYIERLRKKYERLKKKLDLVEQESKEYRDYGVCANNFIKRVCRSYIRAYESKVFDSIVLGQCDRYSNQGLSVEDAKKFMPITLVGGKFALGDIDEISEKLFKGIV